METEKTVEELEVELAALRWMDAYLEKAYEVTVKRAEQALGFRLQ